MLKAEEAIVNMSHMLNEYNLGEKKLFNTLLDGFLLPKPYATQDNDMNKKYYRNDLGIELIVRPNCNQQCEYCYIYKYGKDLYPHQISREEILHNIDLIFDYIFNQRKNFLYEIELFAGDLFYDAIYFDILDIYDKYLKKIKSEAPELFDRQILICCPCNLRWVYEKPELIERFRKYYKYFDKEYGVFLSFSWSTDGLYAVESREKSEFTDEYFDTIFKFCKEFQCGYHPMIAPENIKTWKENYDWWMKKYEQFELTYPRFFQPYMLEVRNNNWTDELIQYHNEFLEHMMDWRLKMCNYDKEKLAYHLFVGDGADGTLASSHGCDPLSLWDTNGDAKTNEGMLCSAQNLIHFDCSALSIVSCHRTSYLQFTPVYFETDENKEHIIDFRPNNIGAYITWRFSQVENWPICSTCDYALVCKKGCPGSQFEDSGELYMPITSLCNYFKQTYDFLYELYKKYGVIEIAKEKGWIDLHPNTYEFIKSKMRQEEEGEE